MKKTLIILPIIALCNPYSKLYGGEGGALSSFNFDLAATIVTTTCTGENANCPVDVTTSKGNAIDATFKEPVETLDAAPLKETVQLPEKINSFKAYTMNVQEGELQGKGYLVFKRVPIEAGTQQAFARVTGAITVQFNSPSHATGWLHIGTLLERKLPKTQEISKEIRITLQKNGTIGIPHNPLNKDSRDIFMSPVEKFNKVSKTK